MSHSESSTYKRRIAPLAFFAVILLIVMGIHTAQHFDDGSIESAANTSASHRKLMNHAAMEKKQENEKIKGKGKGKTRVMPERIWGDKCSKSDIVISQGATESLPNGIPTYTVEIMNVCTSGSDISEIHLNCGWFSSARLINPHVFKRLSFDDCLVNDGKPLSIGRTLSFQYANTFPYRLSVWSVNC